MCWLSLSARAASRCNRNGKVHKKYTHKHTYIQVQHRCARTFVHLHKNCNKLQRESAVSEARERVQQEDRMMARERAAK